jgi:probable phosphoglycerate mutase
MKLLIVRHADPDYPNNTITSAGHQEAQALAKRMVLLGLDRIYSSPLGRALDTMRYSADALGLEPVILPWTAELNWPPLEQSELGKSAIWDTHGHTIHQPGNHYTRHNWHKIPPFDSTPDYQEGFKKVQTDSDAFIGTLGYQRESDHYRVLQANREKIAVFCHGGFGLTWLAHLLNIPLPLVWGGFFLPPSSVTTILFDERSKEYATPRCLGVGDISHLYAEKLPMQPAGIKCNQD